MQSIINKKLCVIAIDRAKKDAADSCLKLKKEFGLEVNPYLLVNKDFKKSPAYKGDEASGYFEEIVLDFDDKITLKKTVDDITKDSDITVVHCIIEAAMGDCASVITYVKNGYCQTPLSLETASEKSKMREAFMANFPEITPKFVNIRNIRSLETTDLKDFSYPLIIKPNGLTSSFLVIKCDNFNELAQNVSIAFSEIDKVYQREHGVGDKSILIEEFIEGDMYSVDAFVMADGKTMHFMPLVRVVTANDVGLEGFYGYQRILPVELNATERTLAEECASKAMQAVGLKSSAAHVELYQTRNGWKVVELGPRIGGYRQELYKLAYDLDNFYNDFLTHLNIPPIVSSEPIGFAAAINIYPDKTGVISSMNGIDEAGKLGSLFSLKTHAKVGDLSKPAVNGGKYVVDAILHSKTEDELLQDIKRLRGLVQVDIT
ncbi:MAG: ATP-grasp domain-containing protein [bacterium]|nr:ATP-grasp domain-containing protein [bacterium]